MPDFADINNLAAANLSDVNGLAKASMSDWNGLTTPGGLPTPLYHWKFENNLVDTIGTGDATQIGTVAFPSVSPKVGTHNLQTNGTTNALTIPTDCLQWGNAGGRTITFWIRTTTQAYSTGADFGAFPVVSADVIPLMILPVASSIFIYYSVPGQVQLTAGQPAYGIVDGAWHLVAFGWDGSTTANSYKAYLNRDTLNSYTPPNAFPSSTNATGLNQFGLVAGTYVSLEIDDMQIFPVVLDQTQVNLLYDAA